MNQNKSAILGHFRYVLLLVLLGLVTYFLTRLVISDGAEVVLAADTTQLIDEQARPSIEQPTKVYLGNSNNYFYYGAQTKPETSVNRKIVIALPGRGETAQEHYDYSWRKYIKVTGYDLAVLNWWDGVEHAQKNYMSPEQVVKQTKIFLRSQGYTSLDTVVLAGFSRGSSNTFTIASESQLDSTPIFDAVISVSGGYREEFPIHTSGVDDLEIFNQLPWVMACGANDPNPNRNGCPAMEYSKTVVLHGGANVIALINDQDGDHFSFFRSNYNYPAMALKLIDRNTWYGQKY